MKNRKISKKIVIILSVILVILIILAAVLFMKKSENNDVTQSESFSPMGNEEAGDSAMTIETKYCNLYYPARWEQQLETKEKGDSVSFYSVIGNDTTKLFEVVFGSEEGSLVGHLDIDGKSVPVCFIFDEIIPESNWDEKVTFSVYAMQEDLNYVIEKLREEPNFAEAN